jgi:hypothetical protein
MATNLGETTLTERLVLLALAGRARDDETPATSAELQTVCQDCLDDVEADVVGRITEADVTRALNSLAAGSLVEEAMPKRSPVGKGRPAYTLGMDPDAALAELAADDRLTPLVDRVD